MYTETCTTSL